MAQQDKHVRDFMTPDPVCVKDGDSIRDAAKIMAREDTGVVPVVNGKKIIGLITDRDIVVRLVAEGKDPGNARVTDAMSKDVRSVHENASVNDALELMSKAHIRRVPVVNRNDEIVGIVSIGDIAEESAHAGRVGKTMEEISEAPPNS